MSIKDLLKTSVPKKLHSKIPSSFDILGNREKAVAIVEIPPELKRRRKKIAAAIMKQHKNVSTVLEKGSPRKGVFRLRDYMVIAGSKDTEVMHVESGCRFLLDPRRAYFSQREATERLRIAAQVRNGETVLVFFAGAGPFPIVISKKTGARLVAGIEFSPDAAEYFRKNVALNRCRNVEVVEGDVRKAAGKYSNCDRVVMPLPEKSLDYLPEALACSKQGAAIHIYVFGAEEDVAGFKERIRAGSKRAGKKIAFTGKSNVLPYGPRIWKMRIDIMVK